MLRLILLGGLRLEDAGAPVEGRAAQKRRLALLSLLAVPAGHLVSRDKLVGYLWPDRSQERARRLLSTALYDIRRELGDELIRTPGDEVGLDPSAITSDAAEFLEAIEAGDLERAADLYGGPFLDGAYPGDSPQFEQWVDAERQRYARMYRNALEQLAVGRDREGKREEAVAFWRRLANVDPCNKRVAVGYITALAAVGERARALQFYGVYAALLREEYGAEPDREVEKVAEQLRDQPAATAAEDSARELPRRDRTESQTPEQAFASDPGPPTVVLEPERGSSRWRAGVVVALVALLALATLGLLSDRSEGAGAEPIRVAVLPLENQSGPDAEHFATGLTEEILLALAQVEGFRVPGPASSFAYQDREQRADPRAVARELGVEYLLSGSVRKDEERLRASVMLTDAATEFVLWSGSYDSRSSGHLGVQEQIARAVVAELRPQLGRAEGGKAADSVLLARSSGDQEAHTHYLRARGLWYDRTPRALMSALQELNQAVSHDPRFARAYAGIADVYNIMGAYDYALLPPAEAYPAAKDAAQRALELEPQLPEAHAALGVALFNYDWDLRRAEEQLTTALALNSGDSMARHWYSLLLRVMGRDEEAMRQIEEAQERDPRSVVLAAGLCRHHYFAHRFARAREACERALALDSDHVQAHLASGMVAVQQGRPEAAMTAYRKATELLGSEAPVVLALEAHARAAAGDTASASELYRRLETSVDGPEYVPPHFLALAALASGEDDEAVRWLEVALEQRSGLVLYLPHEPIIDPLWRHPGLQRLLDRARDSGLGPVLDARDR